MRVFLMPVHDEHGGVEVEDQPSRWPRPSSHPAEKAIVQGAQFGEGCRSHAPQEAPERRGLGVTRQSGEVLEDAVLSQQLRGLDPFESQDHRIQQRQQHLADGVSVVPLHPADLAGDGIAETDPRDEAVHEIDAAVVRQRRRAELDRELPRPPRLKSAIPRSRGTSWPLTRCRIVAPRRIQVKRKAQDRRFSTAVGPGGSRSRDATSVRA